MRSGSSSWRTPPGKEISPLWSRTSSERTVNSRAGAPPGSSMMGTSTPAGVPGPREGSGRGGSRVCRSDASMPPLMRRSWRAARASEGDAVDHLLPQVGRGRDAVGPRVLIDGPYVQRIERIPVDGGVVAPALRAPRLVDVQRLARDEDERGARRGHGGG